MRKTGDYEYLGNNRHFIPDSLPPKDPPLILDSEISTIYGEAMLQLGKLNEMTIKLPDLNRFIKAYVIKEALLSSAIEGIHTTLLDIFTQPLLESKPSKNTQLVMNYVQAIGTALSMIQKAGLPISSRVILAAHKSLMELGEGDKSNSGHYRKQSVKVGNLIPPPASLIPKLIAELENYINLDDTHPLLIKAGLAHLQFETIHPFLDGNGRIGRLLIVLMLIEGGLLSTPILYLSYYFKKFRHEYYYWLDRVRTHGDFEGWIRFYLTAIKESSIDAYTRAKDIESLNQELTQIIMGKEKSEKARDKKLRSLSVLFMNPMININELSFQLDVSYNSAGKVISDFVELGFLVEETQQKRGKLFKFKPYLDVLEREY